jgi:hypothetical protein
MCSSSTQPMLWGSLGVAGPVPGLPASSELWARPGPAGRFGHRASRSQEAGLPGGRGEGKLSLQTWTESLPSLHLTTLVYSKWQPLALMQPSRPSQPYLTSLPAPGNASLKVLESWRLASACVDGQLCVLVTLCAGHWVLVTVCTAAWAVSSYLQMNLQRRAGSHLKSCQLSSSLEDV